MEEEEFVLDDGRLDDIAPSKVDLRLRTFQDMGRLCRLFPGAYFDHDKGAWLCRKCQSFAFPSMASNPWISEGVRLGDHPMRKMNSHFGSNLHKQSIETEKNFRKPSVYEMLKKYNAEVQTNSEVKNRIVLKTMFIVVLYMVKHRLPNDSFEDLMNLVAEAGSVDVKKYLSEAPKNATYMSIQSFKEILEVMNEYVESPILEAAKGQFFTLFIDETTAIGNKSVANIFIMFSEGNIVKEHYLGTVNMNAGLGLTGKHFYKASKELCEKKGLLIEKCAFSEMDGCATNQGRRKGLKLYFNYHNPHHISESCGSHKIALLPKKLIVEGQFECLQNADNVAVRLSAFFQESSLRTAVLENTQKVLNFKVLKLISPASTRWLSHLQCSKRLIEVLPSVLPALNAIYVEKEDMKALGFMLAIIRPDFLLSCLALHDIFEAMSVLIHWLQTSPSKADITKVPILVQTTVTKLRNLARGVAESNGNGKETETKCDENKFTVDEFSIIYKEVVEFVKSTPAAGSCRQRRTASDSEDFEAVFEDFKYEIFVPFAEEMAENIEQSLELNPICKSFSCLDVRNFPETDLDNFGKEELDILIGWYGAAQRAEFPGNSDQWFASDPMINPEETKAEYLIFKKFLRSELLKFRDEKKKAVEAYERKLISIKKNNSSRDKRKVHEIEKEIKEFNNTDLTLNDVYSLMCDPSNSLLMPNMKKLVLMAALSPVGNAVVERLFSLLNITKTVLRNRLGDSKLDMLLRLKVEGPEKWTETDKEELVELWIKKREREGRSYRWKL